MQQHDVTGEDARRQEMALIDVRSPAEFGAVHAEGAQNVPLDQLDAETCKGLATANPDGPALGLICKSGARAATAADRFREAGIDQVQVVRGGTDAWLAAGLPVVRGAAHMSLERQVRIAAGSLVLIGLGLGLGVHPGFLGISGFVGAGLVFAGITDTCGMGLLLARMPWNQRTS
jgi:rhodanese-related sulfurtransferase